jgi:predicted nuclease of restriction endonuclease-like RecB superfamily
MPKKPNIRSSPNKYKAVPTTIDGIKFPSRFEAEVYQKLNRICDRQCWKLTTQHSIVVLPKSDAFSPTMWKCDFAIWNGETRIYVEAKGRFLDDFNRKMQMLAYSDPDTFDRLIIVVRNNYQSKFPKGLGSKSIELSALDAHIVQKHQSS